MNALRPLIICISTLLLAATIHGAVLSTTTTSSAARVMVVTPEPPATPEPPTTPEPVETQEIAAQPVARSEKTGRAYHKSDADDEYPTGYSAPDAHLYPAGHSADGHSGYADAGDDLSGPDHHGAHYPEHQPYGHHTAPAILVNAAYDPTAFQNFVPQFYETYAGGKHHLPHEMAYAVPVWPAPQPGALTVHDYALHHGVDPYAPTDAPTTTTTTTTTAPGSSSGLGVGLAVVSQVLPRGMAMMLMRSVSFLLSSLGVILFGGAVTTAVCALTPLCTITFALGLRQSAASTIQQVLGESLSKTVAGVESSGSASSEAADAGGSGTGSRIAEAAQIVGRAIEKYQRIQAEADAVAVAADAAVTEAN